MFHKKIYAFFTLHACAPSLTMLRQFSITRYPPTLISQELEHVQKRAMRIICPGMEYQALALMSLPTVAEHHHDICTRTFKCIMSDPNHKLRWLNTVFDTSVSFTFFSKTLDPLVTKNGSKQVNNTNFNFLIIKLTYVPLPWQHDQI